MIVKNKQDYNKLAYYFVKVTNTETNHYSYSECDTILQGLLKILELDNPKFNSSKFLKKINSLKHSKVIENE